MNSPLSVYVLYHSAYTEGSKVYSALYSTLCRDHNNPFMDGLDIPVYFCTGDDTDGINEVKGDNSTKKLYLLLVDINMFCSEQWREYVERLMRQESNGDLKVYGVALFKDAFSFNTKLGNAQFIKLRTESVIDSFEEFQTRLYDNIIRYLRETDTEKIRIFISHSKRDEGNTGETLALELRDFLRSDTKLDSFFDASDILDGCRFDDRIEHNVKNSVLMILFTDTYSSREWCRREVLTAKKNKVPAIVVFAVKGQIDRVFPYIGNIPSIVFNNDWRQIVNLMLRTTLDQYYEAALLSSMVKRGQEYIPFPPEAHSFSILENMRRHIVLYPEPPLGGEEMEVLNGINHQVSFVTPIQFQAAGVDLKDMKVAISISDSEDIRKYGVGEELLRDLTVELSRHILIAKGKMVYGGDLRKGGYTEVFRELSNQYGQYEKTENDYKYFENYLAWPIYNAMTLDVLSEYMNSRIQLRRSIPKEVDDSKLKQFVPPITVENRFLWARALTTMRKDMEDAVRARILVGGRKSGFKGSMPGLLEEFLLAKNAAHAIFLLGGFGGVSRSIVDIIEKKGTSKNLREDAEKTVGYKELCSLYEEKGYDIDYSQLDNLRIEDLNNGLNENKTLFYSSNVIEIIQLILKGLSKI